MNELYWTKFAATAESIGADPAHLIACMRGDEKQASELPDVTEQSAYMHGFYLKCAEFGADPDVLTSLTKSALHPLMGLGDAVLGTHPLMRGTWNQSRGRGSFMGKQLSGLRGGLKSFWQGGAGQFGAGRQQGMQQYQAQRDAQRNLGKAQNKDLMMRGKGFLQAGAAIPGMTAAFAKGLWSGGAGQGAKAVGQYAQSAGNNLLHGNQAGIQQAKQQYAQAKAGTPPPNAVPGAPQPAQPAVAAAPQPAVAAAPQPAVPGAPQQASTAPGVVPGAPAQPAATPRPAAQLPWLYSGPGSNQSPT